MAELVDELGGKSVITADNGEMLGEKLAPFTRRLWSHGSYCTEQLCLVPWLETTRGERRAIFSDSPVERTDIDEETVNERLQALGYQ